MRRHLYSPILENVWDLIGPDATRFFLQVNMIDYTAYHHRSTNCGPATTSSNAVKFAGHIDDLLSRLGANAASMTSANEAVEDTTTRFAFRSLAVPVEVKI